MKVLAFPKESDKNPYTSLLYTSVEKLGIEVSEFDPRMGMRVKGDVLHVHWPEWFLARRNPIAVMRSYSIWMDSLRNLKSHGTKIVWTAHNLRTHEKRHELLQRKFWKEFVPLVDGCICLSDVSMSLVREAFPSLKCPSTVVQHGHYRDVYPNDVSRESARRQLDIEPSAFVFVHVGMIREYKNVPELIGAFSSVAGDVVMVVAGEVFDEGLKYRIETAAKGDTRVRLKLRRVADSDLQSFFKASDIAVFPYRNILNSGSALMALSFDTPVLVPGIGSMPELCETVGKEWVMNYQGEIGSQTLEEAMAWVNSTPRGMAAPLDGLNWIELARKTVEFYSLVLGR